MLFVCLLEFVVVVRGLDALQICFVNLKNSLILQPHFRSTFIFFDLVWCDFILQHQLVWSFRFILLEFFFINLQSFLIITPNLLSADFLLGFFRFMRCFKKRVRCTEVFVSLDVLIIGKQIFKQRRQCFHI